MIPDATGTMYAYRIKDDGSVDTSYPAQSADALLNPANTQINKVKVDAETAPIAKNIADWVTNTGKTLGLTLENPRNHTQYQSFVDGAANNVLSTSVRTASVLYDSLGYKAVWTEEEHKKNPDAVYMKSVNGVLSPEITPEQKKAASDYVKATLDAQVKHIESQKFEPTTPKVVVPKEGKKEKPEDKPSIGEISYIVKSGKNTGQAVGVSNVKQKIANGVERTIDIFGVDNGKFFINYTEYNGKEKIGDSKASSTSVIGIPKQYYGDKNDPEKQAMIRLVPNPETGKNFTSVQEAKKYIETHRTESQKPTTNKGFDYEKYYKEQMLSLIHI